MGDQAVAIVRLDGVLRPDRDAAVDDGRGLHRAGQALGVTGGDAVPRLDLVGEDGELLQQDGGLDGVHPGVHADAHVQVLGVVIEGAAFKIRGHRLAVDPQADQQVMEARVLRQHRPAIAVAAQRLGREE
jgi:hypothetical protein